MKRLLLATRNEGKVREFRALLAGLPVPIETLASHPEAGDLEETGKGFEENARLKASAAARSTGLWALGEDSGLMVDALGGAPGVLSARYAGVHGDDRANNAKLIRDLQGVQDRTARYVCAVALARPDGDVVAVAQGTCEGHVVEEPRGAGGFGYDPYFVAAGESRTNAELDPEEKDAISHRGQALRSMVPLLRVYLATSGADSDPD